MNPILCLCLVVLTARTFAIPTNLDCNGDGSHAISKREIAYENLWINKNEPLDICPTVEASLIPSLRSRMYDSSEEFDEELDDIFLPIKYHREVPWAINSPASVPGEYFIPTKKYMNNVYSPPNLIVKPDDNYFVNSNKAYLNTKNIDEIFDEPTDEELQVFFKLDDLNEKAPKYDEGQKYFTYYQHPPVLENETPKMIKIEDVENQGKKELPVPLIYDPVAVEESELTAETHDIVDVEINETEKIAEPMLENVVNPVTTPPKEINKTSEVKEEVNFVTDGPRPTTPQEDPTTTEENERKEESQAEFSSSRTKVLINEMLDSIKGIENFQKIEKTLTELIGDLEAASTSEFQASEGEALIAAEINGSAKSLQSSSEFFIVNICGFYVFLLRYLS